jgi:hypothetical protein
MAGRSEPGLLRRIGRAAAGLATAGRLPERGFFAFTLQTLLRSGPHRLVLAGALAAGCAFSAVIVVSSMYGDFDWHSPTTEALMSVQLLLMFCAAAGMRSAAAIPSELRANWVFRLTDPGTPARWLRGFRRAVLLGIMLPLLLLQIPVNVAFFGARTAGIHFVVGLVLAGTILEVLFLGFRKVPFACSLVTGQNGPRARWAFYWIGFSLYSFTLAAIEARVVDHPVGLAWFIGAITAAWAGAAAFRAKQLAEGFPAQFEDASDLAVQTLDLGP